MTPEQLALDNNIKQTPTIQSLEQGQEDIMTLIKEDREQNKEDFEKGIVRFKKLEGEMDDMKIQIAEGFDSISGQIREHIAQTDKDEIKKLNKKLEAKEYVKSGIIIALVSGIVLTMVGVIVNNYVVSKPTAIEKTAE